MTITDAHIHVQPWWEMKPEMLDVMTRGRQDLDELKSIMKSPARLLRLLDKEGIDRAVLVNYPAPEMLGFTHSVNDYVTQYCAEAPDRLIPMGGVHPRHTDDAAAELELLHAGVVRGVVSRLHQCVGESSRRGGDLVRTGGGKRRRHQAGDGSRADLSRRRPSSPHQQLGELQFAGERPMRQRRRRGSSALIDEILFTHSQHLLGGGRSHGGIIQSLICRKTR